MKRSLAFAISIASGFLAMPALGNPAPQSQDTPANDSQSQNPTQPLDSRTQAAQHNKTHHTSSHAKSQQMKDCMAQQKANNSSSMSQTAMETVCKNQVNKASAIKNGYDLSTGPQANPPATPPQQ